jgi:hypothetical protein
VFNLLEQLLRMSTRAVVAIMLNCGYSTLWIAGGEESPAYACCQAKMQSNQRIIAVLRNGDRDRFSDKPAKKTLSLSLVQNTALSARDKVPKLRAKTNLNLINEIVLYS